MMDSRERIYRIINGETTDRCGFWLGSPNSETWEIYQAYYNNLSQEEIRKKLGDELRHIGVGVYKHPDGKPMWNIERMYHGAPGPLADCKSIEEVEDYEYFPNPDYIDYEEAVNRLKAVGPYYRATGLWTAFYHHVMDLFGMENYLIKMYESPEIVHAVTDKVCDFFYKANEHFFEIAGSEADAFFFGNDFGTQQDLICGPNQFDEFLLPWFRKFIELAHHYNKQVILHSCGSIYKIIDRLIDAQVDCLHPLQAKAKNMNAEYLAEHFKGKITFMGGIDTQDLLINATPDDVRVDVQRVKELLGPRLIISPSHEALLPNVPIENVIAMSDEALS